MSCPNIDSLNAEENQAHVQSCPACRSLFAMHTLKRPEPDSCEDVDGLIGLLGALTAQDSQRLHEHLADCPACMVTYLTLVDDEAAPTTHLPSWKGPSMEIAHKPHMFANHKALVGGLCFLVVALLVVLLAGQTDEAREVAAGSPEQATDEASPVAGPNAVEQTAAERTAPSASRPGPVAPVAPTSAQTNSPAQVLLSGRGSQLAGMTEEALREGRMSDALGYCSEAMQNAPIDDATSYVCALANCSSNREQATFERLAARIKSPTLRGQADKECAERDTGWTIDVTCDEVTCLVAPEKTCCLAKKERANPARRPASEVQPIESAKVLVKKAEVAVRASRYKAGLKHCEAALDLEPDNLQARMICGIAACNLGMAERAKGHIENVKGEARKASLKQICIRGGVTL